MHELAGPLPTIGTHLIKLEVVMPEEVCPLHLTANQCRERARLVRNFAKGVSSALLRQDLLDIAGEYERRAESTKQPAINVKSEQAGPLIQAIGV